MTDTNPSPEDRLIRLAEVRELVPASPATLWRWEKQNRFPKRIRISRNLTCWKLSEVRQWIAEQEPRAA